VSRAFAKAVRALPFRHREVAAWAGFAPHTLKRNLSRVFPATDRAVARLRSFAARIGYAGEVVVGAPKTFAVVEKARGLDWHKVPGRRKDGRWIPPHWTAVPRLTKDDAEFAGALKVLRRLRGRVMGRRRK